MLSSMCQAHCGQTGWLFFWATQNLALCANVPPLTEMVSPLIENHQAKHKHSGGMKVLQREGQGGCWEMGHDSPAEQEKSSEDKIFLSMATQMRSLSPLLADLSYLQHSRCRQKEMELQILLKEFWKELGRRFFSQKLGEPCSFWTQTADPGSLKRSVAFWDGHCWSVLVGKVLWKPRRSLVEGMSSPDSETRKSKDIRQVSSRCPYSSWPI